jgi:multiple sugar transport system substrate-binding protein
MIELKVLGWGHRRATDPLKSAISSFREKRPDVAIELDVRPLSDFEHQGIDSVARLYDMVVYDHPFSGDIASGRVFLPLDEHLPELLNERAGARYVGATLSSYRYAGTVWGAPVDAATQHALVRKDLLDSAGEPVPASWQETIKLGARLQLLGLKLGMAVETPHALLVVAALMANRGKPWSTDPDAPLHIDRTAFEEAFGQLRQLLAFCPAEALAWNSIDLHEAMVARDDVAYCPCVYGYATYGEADMRTPLAFANFAGTTDPYHAGSAIGGTALGVSRYSRAPEAALAFAAHMIDDQVQEREIPEHHGQPALLSAWERPDNDRRFNGFYSAVRASMDTVWIRPRLPGYSEFQRDAGDAVAAALRGTMDERTAIDRVMILAERVNG